LEFKEFGWNNIFLEIPEEMRFSRQGGNSKDGFFLLEAEDYFVEVRWETFDSKKIKSLPEILDALIEQIRKKIKKGTTDIKVVNKEDTFVCKHKALYAIILSKTEERFCLWYCDETSRVITLRFVFKELNENSKIIVRRMLETFNCHGEKSKIWSLMDLSFALPHSLLLTETQISVGRAHFIFTEQKSLFFAEKITKVLIEYFSMANLVFKDTYKDIEKWFKEKYQKDLIKRLREGKVEFETLESRKFRRHSIYVKNALKTSGLTWRKTSFFYNFTWYCSNANRIYSLTIISSIKRPLLFKREIDKDGLEKMLQDFLSTFKCH